MQQLILNDMFKVRVKKQTFEKFRDIKRQYPIKVKSIGNFRVGIGAVRITLNLVRCGNNSQMPMTAISSMGNKVSNPCCDIINLKVF